MGRIYGPYRIIGRVGGIRHYTMNGGETIYAAGLGGANKNLIMNHPAFARTRENMAEMTPRSKMAKKIKLCFGQWSATIVNRYLIGAINAALYKVQKGDSEGLRGSRSLYLSKHRELISYMNYYYYKPFSDIMKCPYTVETSPDRKSVSVTLKNLIPDAQIKPPNEASHFRFCLSIGVVSDVVFNPVNGCYEKVYEGPKMMECSKAFEGEWIPVDTKTIGDVTYSVSLRDTFEMEEDMTAVRMFGIVFGKMTSEVEELKKDRGSCEFLGAI
jgi:hypothetical protein